MLSRLFNREFVINEKPLEVFAAVEPSDANTTNGAAAGAIGRNEDLLSSISHLMKEHEKLADLANALKEQNQNSDSFEPFMQKMLTFLDSFERVLFLGRNYSVSEEISNWLKSVETIYYRELQLLESFGLVALPSVGQTVNLDIHEVVELVAAPDRPAGVIIAERRKGYAYRGKLLRCAQVVVSQEGRI